MQAMLHNQITGRRVAVIGGGISGLGAAYTLRHTHHVTLFEAAPKLGGHARTVMAGKQGDLPVDTGFLVYNHQTYPNLIQLFGELDVPTQTSDMSFGVSIDGGRFEYGLMAPSAILAQKSNLLRPQFINMLRDILRFNKLAKASVNNTTLSIGELIQTLGLGNWFRDYYLLPFTGAIWSTPLRDIMNFPAKAMIDFMENHGLLAANQQHQWYTVRGGSQEYVRRLQAALSKAGVQLRLSAPIAAVRRGPVGVQVKTWGSDWEHFDHVILATHSDDTLAMIADPSGAETAALGAVKYQPNHMILHADTSIMPKRKAAWASWVYSEDKNHKSDRIDLTYWINRLQSLPADDPCFVTLNTNRKIDDHLIYDTHSFRHPVFDAAAHQA